MCKICIFGGTTEGRKLVEFLSGQEIEVYTSVATDYGETLIAPAENVTVSVARLTAEGMAALFREQNFDCVVDATHPYAPVVTDNILTACREVGVDYIRLLREEDLLPENAIVVENTQGAVDYLSTFEGNVFLSTGSKEVAAYSAIPGFAQRVYVRVLPMADSLAACERCGLPAAHVLAMQGPFSEEMNLAMLRDTHADILVTKDSGSRGGFPEKAAAARKAGIPLLVVGRPAQVAGSSYEQVVEILTERYHLRPEQGGSVEERPCVEKPLVSIVGIGTGNEEERTVRCERVIREADCLIGAERMLRAAARPGQLCLTAIAPEAIRDMIRSHPECRRFAVVMSGDVGFFSGTKKLLPLLDREQVELVPGLSSMVVLCNRLGKSYEDVAALSLHGREGDVVAALRQHKRLFVLVGGENGAGELCRRLVEAGYGEAQISVGEQLGYSGERIRCGSAAELANEHFHSLSAVLVEHEGGAVVTHGLPDSAFVRGRQSDGRAVPMTKREIRSVAISALALTGDAVCWDIGAGTGSVSIEMALQAPAGSVYAVEKNPAALELLEENAKRFHTSNLHVVSGSAPEACRDLPAPSHVFIGGSSGNMGEILALAREKNPSVRIVATAIALETVSELTACMGRFAHSQVVSIAAAQGREAGPYHLMFGQNPVYVFTFTDGEEEE